MNILPPPGPQRWKQLGFLGLMLALIVYYAPKVLWPDDSSAGPAPSASARTASGGASGSANAAKPGAPKVPPDLPVPVELASLEAPTEGNGPEAGRNPFRFGEPPKPPPPPVVPQVYTPPPPPLPPPPPPEPKVDLTLTMVMQDANGAWQVSLKDKNGTSFQAYEGQVVDGRYRLLKVARDSVVMAFLDGKGQASIRISR